MFKQTFKFLKFGNPLIGGGILRFATSFRDVLIKRYGEDDETLGY